MEAPGTGPMTGSREVPGEPMLIHAAQQGNLKAFNHLLLDYQDEIFTLVTWLAPHGEGAEAVVHCVVRRLYRELPRYRSGDFRIWVVKLLVKVCREVWRTSQHGLEGRSTWRRYGSISSMRGPTPNGKPGWGKQNNWGTLEEVIMDRLVELPFELRLAVTLVDIEGLDYERAAEVIGTSISEIRGRLAKARRYLCQPLAEGLASYEV